MVFNDSFSTLFGSPATLKKTNDSFNESFGDKSTLSAATIFRILQKEHDQISSVLRFHPPTSSQYQNSLIELISLFERCEDQSTLGFQKLTLSIFLKLAGNLLTGLIKPKNQPTLYKLAQLIASSVVPDLGPENEIEENQMKKWADRVVIESSIHLLDFPNYQLDLEFDIDSIVDDLGLATGRFQFVKSSIFESARSHVSEMPINTEFLPESRFSLENAGDEPFLQLILWIFLRKRNIFNGDLLPRLFPTFPQTPNAEEIVKSPVSILDLKIYLVSLAVISSTTTESGMTAKHPPTAASQLALTKQQKECWKAVVTISSGKPVSALSRLRVSQLTDSVRLTSDSSEDVRVLFEAWKCCLQPSAADDEAVFAAVKALTELYRTKMNSILAYGPFYSSDPSSFAKQTSSGARRDMKNLFPLQFDYEFVDTTEAGHIGVVINSLEGYLSVSAAAATVNAPESHPDDVLEVCSDDTFHSFTTVSDTSRDQFFSPMRPSMCPTAISQLIREESAANTSHISTKSLILTPTRGQGVQQNLSMSPITTSSGGGAMGNPMLPMGLTYERLQTFQVSTPIKSSSAPPPKPKYFEELTDSEDDEEEYVSDDEEEEDPLEAALLESKNKHETSLLAQKSPMKVDFGVKKTPTKDAQTETDDVISSSESSSIVSVKYTPRKGESKILFENVVKEEEEYEEDEYVDEISSDEDEEYDEEYDEEEEQEHEEELTEQMEEQIFEGALEATTLLFRDHYMQKEGILQMKIDYDSMTEDEFVLEAEQRLAQMKIDMMVSVKRLEECIQADNQAERQHDSTKCLGCQPERVQEAALRLLDQMALDWDAEGNDYIYE